MRTRATTQTSGAQAGNIFFAIFGAIAVVGLLGAGLATFVSGPLSSSVKVTRQSITENQMVIAAQTALMNASSQPSQGDCDNDAFVEPVPWRDAGALPHPAGGGLIPNSIAAPKRDPWGTDYGYCVWDNGPLIADAGCGTDRRLSGHSSAGYPALAIVAAGPDRTFQTTCRNFRYPMNDMGGTPDPARADTNEDGDLLDAGDFPLISKNTSASDDVIFSYTYEQAIAASGDLWTLVSAGATAALAKDLEVDGSAAFTGSGDFIGVTGDAFSAVTGNVIELPPIKLPDASTYNPTCDATTMGTIRTNLGISTPPAMSSATATQGFNNADTSSVSFSGAPSAGNSIIVSVRGWTSGGFDLTANNVTDNQGNTYTLVGSGGTNGENTRVFMFAAYNIAAPSGAFTITIDPTGTGAYGAWGAMEVSGISAASLSITGGGNGAGTATATGTTATANSFAVGLIGVFGDDGELSNYTYDSAGGWAQPLVKNDIPSMSTVTKVIPTAGSSVSHTWGYGTNTVYAVREFMAVWSPAAPGGGGGGGGTTPMMTLMTEVNPADVDLTALGYTDWAWWGTSASLAPATRKSGGGSLISNAATYGGNGLNWYNNAYREMSWTDGNSPASDASNDGIYNGNGPGRGFELAVPADTTLRTLKVYAGYYNASSIRVTTILSDGSVSNQVDTTLPTAIGQPGNSRNVVFTVNYRAASAGQTMTVRWEILAGAGDANVTLQAAALDVASGGGSGTGTAPVFVAASDGDYSNVLKPAGTQSGDFLLLAISGNNDANPVFTLPAGFQEITRSGIGSPNPQAWILAYKFAGGSEPAGYSISGGGWDSVSLSMIAFRGVDPSDPIDVFGEAHTSHPGTADPWTIVGPSLTTTRDNTMVTWFGGLNPDNYDGGISFTPPVGFTERVDSLVGGSLSPVSLATRVFATAGSTGVMTGAAETWAGPSTAGTAVLAIALNGVGTSGGGGSCSNGGGGGGSSDAPTLAGVSTDTGIGGAVDIARPSGTTEGDLLLLGVSADNGQSMTVPWPAGFVEIEIGGTTSPDGQGWAMAYKIATAAEPSSYSFTISGTSGTAAVMATYSGIDAADPIADSYDSATAALGTSVPWTITGGSLTTANPDSRVVWFAAADPSSDVSSGQPINVTVPSGFTERADIMGGTGWTWLAMGDASYASAGATGALSGSATSTSGVNAAFGVMAVALNPGDSGGTNPIAFVQKSAAIYSGNAATPSLSMPGVTTAGNTIIVPITSWFSIVSSVTDNQGNIYTLAVSSLENGTRTYVYVANNIAGGALTVTVNTGGGEKNFGIMEFSGLANFDLVDTTGTFGMQAGTGSTVNASQISDTDYQLAVAVHDAAYDINLGYGIQPDWTEAFTQNDSSSWSGHSSVYKILDAAEQVSHAWTYAGPPNGYRDVSSSIVTFRADTGGILECPAGYTLNEDRCYKLNPAGSTWAQARTACQADGGDLAVINTTAEQTYLATLYTASEAWVGYSDSAVEGTWTWNTPSTWEQNVNRVCEEIPEFYTMNPTAAAGHVFTSVDFASYGTPGGSCGGYTQGACHAASSSATISADCVGNSSCSITADNTTFGDPCMNTAKSLFVQLRDSSTVWAAGDPDGGASANCATMWRGGSPAHNLADTDCAFTTPESICEADPVISSGGGGGGSSVITIGQMAPAVTGGDPSYTTTFATNPTAGSSIVVPVSNYTRLYHVSDNAGNSYVNVAIESQGTPGVSLYVASNIKLPPSGNLAVTAWVAQYGGGTMRPFEVQGLDPVNLQDQVGEYWTSSGGANTTVTASGANTQANDLAVAVHYALYDINPMSPYAIGGGWTSVHTETDCANTVCHSSAYRILSATETTSHTWTHPGPTNGFDDVAAAVVTLKGNDDGNVPDANIEKVSVLGSGVGGANTLSTSFAVNPTAGNAVIVFIVNETNASDEGNLANGSVTDNQGNTYVRIVDSDIQVDYNSNVHAFIAYNIGTPTGTFTITATAATPQTGRIGAVEVSGVEENGLDATGADYIAYSDTKSISLSSPTTVANTIVFAAVTDQVGGTHKKSDGWSYVYQEADDGVQAISVVARSVNATGAISHTWTHPGMAYGSAIIFALRLSGGSSGGGSGCDDDDAAGNSLLQVCDGNGTWQAVGGGGGGSGVVVEESSTSVCNGSTTSAVRYNTSTARPEYCNGTAWRPFVLNEAGVVLSADPVFVDQINSVANTYSDATTITITNRGSETSGPLAFSFTGTNPANFSHTQYTNATTCTVGMTLAPGASCTKQIAARTAANGPYTANFQITDGGATALVPLSGAGSQNSTCEPGVLGWGGIVVSCLNSTTPYYVVSQAGCATSPSEPACTNSLTNGANNDPDFTNSHGLAYATGNSSFGTPSSGEGDIQTLSLLAYGGARVAATYCNDLVKDGYNDWYLPTHSEFRGLLYPLRASLRFNLGAGDAFWTSSHGYAFGPSEDYGRNFLIDTGISNDESATNNYNTRCMRKHGAPAASAMLDTDPYGVVLVNHYATALSTVQVGPASYVTGINTPVPVTISGSGSPQFQVHDGTSWGPLVTSGTINNLNQIRISSTTPASAGMENVIVLNIGTSSYTYLVRTLQTATRRIFITSTTHNGNLGGFAGADAICQARANSVPLGGTWYALLGGSGVNAFDRIPWNWNRLDNMANVKVADDIGELREYSVDNEAVVNRTQANVVQNTTNVWTGMGYSNWGSLFADSDSCAMYGVAGGQWYSNNGGIQGVAGTQNTMDASWMQNYTVPNCNANRRLYCVGPF